MKLIARGPLRLGVRRMPGGLAALLLPGLRIDSGLVATGIYDAPWGFTLSSKLTLATQAPRYGTNCLAGWTDCKVDQYTPDGNYGEKRLDIAVEKSWNLGGDVKLRTRADLFNVFNWTNYTGYDDWWGAPMDPNPNFGVPNGASYKTRELKVTLGVNW